MKGGIVKGCNNLGEESSSVQVWGGNGGLVYTFKGKGLGSTGRKWEFCNVGLIMVAGRNGRIGI